MGSHGSEICFGGIFLYWQAGHCGGELEVYFNDKLVEICKLPLKYNHRKHELFFNYEQPYGKYKVTCKWTNPVKGADIWVRDVITYTTDK